MEFPGFNQRIQCVLIRATLGSSAAEIAQLLGWSRATVHVIHSRWAKEGEAILRGRGGRHHQHLNAEQEAQVLVPFVAQATAGAMLKVADIQRAYEERVGKSVAPSTIYRMLERHNMRIVLLPPYSPELNPAEHLWEALREDWFANTVFT